MKVKKTVLAILITLSISFMVGCNLDTINNGLKHLGISKESNKERRTSTKLLNEYSKKTNTLDGIDEVKLDLSHRFSKAVEDSGYKIIDSREDGSYALSINLDDSEGKNVRSLSYSFNEDYSKGNAIASIHCAREYYKGDELLKDENYVKLIYKIYKSLTDTEISENDFYKKVKNTFDEGTGIVDLLYKEDVYIKVDSKIKKNVKVLFLTMDYKFDIPKH